MEEEGIRKKLEEIDRKLDEVKQKRTKKFRLPARAKVGNMKLKQGYITVEVINENKEIGFVKEPIVDGTIKLGETFHSVDELDLFTYRGKPFAHVPKTKINPWNPLSEYLNTARTFEGKTISKNEIYGQKYLMSRMKSDAIKSVKKMGAWIWVILAGVAGIIIYALIKG